MWPLRIEKFDVLVLSRQCDTVWTFTARKEGPHESSLSYLGRNPEASRDWRRMTREPFTEYKREKQRLSHSQFAGIPVSCFQLVLADSQCWSTASFQVNGTLTKNHSVSVGRGGLVHLSAPFIVILLPVCVLLWKYYFKTFYFDGEGNKIVPDQIQVRGKFK